MTKADTFADFAAAGSVLTFLGLSMVQWDTVVHLAAGCVAIIAGTCAAIYHIKKIKDLS